MPVFCLSTQADYACRHSGACCTSGWPIHVEIECLGHLRGALAAGRLHVPRTEDATGGPFVTAPDLPPDAAAVLRTAAGACVFYDRESRRCAIHRVLGHHSLPSACQHFPRRCLIEPGRTALSLSHYCPTVARLAFRTDVALAIVPAQAQLSDHLRLEGLDARETLPPLLRPGMLADPDGYRAWERFVIGVLGQAEEPPERMLARVARATRRATSWSPREGLLRDAVERYAAEEMVAAADDGGSAGVDAGTLLAGYAAAAAAVPAPFAAPAPPGDLAAIDARWVAPAWAAFARPLAHFVAAHAFGSWVAYYGAGLATVVRSLEVALAVVRVEAARECEARGSMVDEESLTEAFRKADLLLVHLADPKALAAGPSAMARR
jgi:Fe-S-cluster containining protein